jgi:hypothetical protein
MKCWSSLSVVLLLGTLLHAEDPKSDPKIAKSLLGRISSKTQDLRIDRTQLYQF